MSTELPMHSAEVACYIFADHKGEVFASKHLQTDEKLFTKEQMIAFAKEAVELSKRD